MSKLVAAFTLSGRRELDVCTGEGSREGDDVGSMPTFGGWPHAQSSMRLISMRLGRVLTCLNILLYASPVALGRVAGLEAGKEDATAMRAKARLGAGYAGGKDR